MTVRSHEPYTQQIVTDLYMFVIVGLTGFGGPIPSE